MALTPKIFNLMGQGIVYTVNFNTLWQVWLWKCSQNHKDERWGLATLDRKSVEKESWWMWHPKVSWTYANQGNKEGKCHSSHKQTERPWCM